MTSGLERIAAHHELEARLYRVRLLRDLGNPTFDQGEEDSIIEEGVALWYEMTEEERRILEAERAARHSLARTPVVTVTGSRLVDASLDDHGRRGLPLLREAS